MIIIRQSAAVIQDAGALPALPYQPGSLSVLTALFEELLTNVSNWLPV